jgi:hypothetical protein
VPSPFSPGGEADEAGEVAKTPARATDGGRSMGGGNGRRLVRGRDGQKFAYATSEFFYTYFITNFQKYMVRHKFCKNIHLLLWFTASRT